MLFYFCYCCHCYCNDADDEEDDNDYDHHCGYYINNYYCNIIIIITGNCDLILIMKWIL